MNVLVYSDNDELAAELVTFAHEAGGHAEVVAFGQEQADGLASCGADTLLTVNANDTIPEAYANALSQLVRDRDVNLVAIGATARGRDLAAQMASRLGCGLGAEARKIAIDNDVITFSRMVFGGNVETTEQIEGLAVLTVSRGSYPASAGAVSDVEAVELVPDDRIEVLSREAIEFSGPDLASADRVVCIGMGARQESDVALAQDMADALDGALACSRGIAEERKWMPAEQYIGISGKSVSPKLYLTLGISGQVQHMIGARDAEIVASVNKDENAPISVSGSDYCIIGDMEEYAPLITEAIAARRA